MPNASINVSGPNSERLATELQAALGASAQPGESVSPVEVQRSAELAIATIALVFNGVGTAKILWDWWQERRSTGVEVRVLLQDGTTIDLSTTDGQQLHIALEQRTRPEQ